MTSGGDDASHAQPKRVDIPFWAAGCAAVATATISGAPAHAEDFTAGAAAVTDDRGWTATNAVVYALFVLAALALAVVTIGVLYLSAQSWRRGAEEKKTASQLEKDPKCACSLCIAVDYAPRSRPSLGHSIRTAQTLLSQLAWRARNRVGAFTSLTVGRSVQLFERANIWLQRSQRASEASSETGEAPSEAG